MYRGHRDEEEKKLRRLYEEYRATWGSRWDEDRGQWIEVNPPYQKGWCRFYVLRDDIKNRSDSHIIQKALDLVNWRQYCPRQDFMEKSWKRHSRGQLEPLEQKLNWLTEKQYLELDERVRTEFGKATWTEKRTYPTKHYVTVTGYVLRDPYRFVFYVEPNMIVRQWLPDPEWESHCAEIRNKIQRNYLWPKIDHMLGRSSHPDRDYEFNSKLMQNRYGENIQAVNWQEDAA